MSLTDDLEKLGVSEVRKRLSEEGFGYPDSPTYSSVQEWLRGKELDRGDSRVAELNSIIAEHARWAKWSAITAVVAAIIAAIAAITTMITATNSPK